MQPNPTQSSYDRIAEEYARRMLHELDHKPLDRELLDRFAQLVAGKGRAVDLGCGPGQVARYLHESGMDAFGIDLSPGMVALAQQTHPGVEFRQGDMYALPLPDDSLAGVAAFYSIIHIPRTGVIAVLKEIRRVLTPGGVLLLSFHRGAEILHFDALWDQPVQLDFIFFEPDEMQGYLEVAGFIVDEVIERAPYPDVEVATQRVYVFAHK